MCIKEKNSKICEEKYDKIEESNRYLKNVTCKLQYPTFNDI